MMHGEKKNKAFKCNICEVGFKLEHWLDEHISQVHSEKRMFKCDLCGKSFKAKKSMKRHVEEVHEKKR
jgi:uncharacterized Zn-finger protein